MFSHHAYIVRGGDDTARAVSARAGETCGMATAGNPDFLYLAYESFGVDESRDLKETASRVPIGERKIIVIRSDAFTREAQNALLKLFEDPTPNTHFFVVTPYPRALLPTLLSRMETFVVPGRKEVREEHPEVALAKKAFVGSPRERMRIAEDLHKEEDKVHAVRFLEALVEILEGELRTNRTEDIDRAFSAVSRAASFARDRGASIKTLLEYAVLSLPIVVE